MPFQMTGDFASGLSSAGTTQATATICPADHVLFSTVTQGQGCILKAGNATDRRSVTNQSTSANLLVYPPVGAAINGKSANAPLTLPSNMAAMFYFFDANTISAFY